MHTAILTNITRTLICCSHCLIFLFLRLAKLLAMVFCVDPFDCSGGLVNGKIFPPKPLPPPLVMSFLEEFLWRRECRPLAIEVMINDSENTRYLSEWFYIRHVHFSDHLCGLRSVGHYLLYVKRGPMYKMLSFVSMNRRTFQISSCIANSGLIT